LPLMETLGWSLLHSAWQGALIALVLWAVLQVIRDTMPHARYVLGLVALVTLLALPAVNYRQTEEVWRGHRSWLVSAADVVIRGQLAEGPLDPDAVTADLRRRHATVWAGDTGMTAALAQAGREPAQALAWLWLGGSLLLLGRLGLLSWRACRLAESGAPDPRWRAACRTVAARMDVQRPVRVTDRVDVPALVGWRWPVILVPDGIQPGPVDMEAILAHELAHVRRHDFLANLLQAVVEAFLFYSPAAWWISSRVREERECSCDATAIPALAGGSVHYARSLLNLETARPVIGAVALNGGPLVRRIRRVHARSRDPRPIDWRNAAALVLLAATAWAAAPEPRHPIPLAARVSATSLMLQDLDEMRVVVQTVELPGWMPAREDLPACPPSTTSQEA
jgi:beta-lactamase regulating signal transducer with metallopeptidase domain